MVFRQWYRLSTASGLLLLSISSLTILSFLINSSSAQDGGDTIISRREAFRSRSKRDGSWSDWSPWGPCSRTCGGGIRTQTRQCQMRKSKSSEVSSSDVTRYARNVSNRHCEGHATRHHMCNTQDCPEGTIDFRESQCKAFDNRPFMGKMYQWESFIDERSPCSLTCRAKGFRFFATLNKRVIDGTPCFSNVCIAGACTPIGCDLVAGSLRKLDICGVCGGNNSTCRFFSGIYTRPQLTLGFNFVANIPRGAIKIKVSESSAKNHLALRKQDGSFIFTGNRPGVYDGAGSKFQYSRSDLKALPTIISSSGPLMEAVDLMVLYIEPNTGIKYEYTIPVADVPIFPVPLHDTPISSSNGRLALAATSRPGSFVHNPQHLLSNGILTTNSNSRISSIPSNLKILRAIPQGKSDSTGLLSLPRHHHHHHGRRRGHHHGGGGSSKRDSAIAAASAAVSENPDNKKFYWKIMAYTNCSEPCGGGTQRSIIRCVKAPSGSPVSDRRCVIEQEKPPGQTLRCNLKACPAEWSVGNWTNCSAECGEGLKTRDIYCNQKISPTLTMRVKEGACLQKKPEVKINCQLKSCHRWESSEWSHCTSKCGNGIRKRTVSCVDFKKENGKENSSVIVNEHDHFLCDLTEKPTEIKSCNMGPCDIDGHVHWFISDWSTECSQKCGTGIQTRHVVCSGINKYKNSSSSESYELETNVIEDDDSHYAKLDKRRRSIKNTFGDGSESDDGEDFLCDDSRKPDSERVCFSDRACGEAVWFTGPWGDCSVYCGKGVRTRQVLCITYSKLKFKVISNSLCPIDTKPADKEDCESTKTCPPRWFSTDWGECSKMCGGGIQKRRVSCRSSNWTLPSTLCSDKDRPIERRSCNEGKCSLTIGTLSSSSSLPKINNSLRNSNTDDSGMVKDKPLQQQAAGTSSPSFLLASTSTPTTPRISSTNTNITIYNRTAILNFNLGNSSKVASPFSVLSTTLKPFSTSTSHPDANEEHDDAECSDQYRNCALVVQARLCRYKYYRSVCCNSCTESM